MPNQSVIYTATRSLISGRTSGDLVTTDITLRKKARGRKVNRTQAASISNRRFITYQSSFTTWRCQTPPLNGVDAALMREFLDSCEDQIFSFDPDNPAGASPNALRTVVLSSRGYTEELAAQQASQPNNYFVFSFTMEEDG